MYTFLYESVSDFYNVSECGFEYLIFFHDPKIEISIIFFKINNPRPKVWIIYIVADSCVVARIVPASHRGGQGSIPGRNMSVLGPPV
jgi:hypothetical protein